MLLEVLEARIEHDVRQALDEDLGNGDVTALLLWLELVARQSGSPLKQAPGRPR